MPSVPVEKQKITYCLQCGRQITTGANGKQLFCNDKCRMRYYRAGNVAPTKAD